eukprot:3949024-Prymnesium_polylepis.1
MLGVLGMIDMCSETANPVAGPTQGNGNKRSAEFSPEGVKAVPKQPAVPAGSAATAEDDKEIANPMAPWLMNYNRKNRKVNTT